MIVTSAIAESVNREAGRMESSEYCSGEKGRGAGNFPS